MLVKGKNHEESTPVGNTVILYTLQIMGVETRSDISMARCCSGDGTHLPNQYFYRQHSEQPSRPLKYILMQQIITKTIFLSV